MANGAFDNASFTTAFIDDGMGGINNLEIKIFTLSAINIALTPLSFDLSGHDGMSAPTIAFKASDDSFVYIEYADISGPNFISISDVGASFNGQDAAFGYFEGKWVNNSYSPTIVPIPAAVWLFGSGLLGLVGVARRRKAIV